MILIIILLAFLIILNFNKEKFFEKIFNTNNPVKTLDSDYIYKNKQNFCKNLKVREDGLLCGDCLTSSDGLNYIYSCNFCKLNNYGLRNGNLVCH